MFDLFKKIMPKEEWFFDLFERHATCLTAGSLTLRKLLEGGPEVALLCKILMGQEEQADAIGHEVFRPSGEHSSRLLTGVTFKD